MLRIETKPGTSIFTPLDRVTLHIEGEGLLIVEDAAGREYVRQSLRQRGEFTVGGALGVHRARLLDDAGQVQSEASFRVDCHTEIDDGGPFAELFRMLHHTMVLQEETVNLWYAGRLYVVLATWLRDHVHAVKGLKYFTRHLKDGIELYAETQRPNGMLWDGVFRADGKPTHRGAIFGHGEFAELLPDGSGEFQRIPVENDVEFLFLEGLYYTWKATGDTGWMKSMLPAAMKAVQYATSDPLRWSEKFELLKRGFTIDTWDYQPSMDEARTGHTMVVDVEKSHFCVMHGDNTGMAAGLSYLAEMLEAVDQADDARTYRELEAQIRNRLDEVAWNGRFYTHQVPENPSVERDFGVDQSTQVSLSNSYAINRGATHEQCVAIIREYQRIASEMPESSPGEWYSIYPPFPKGFGKHQSVWGYVNGGVLSLVAGELAHGAFEHGFEAYGSDILQRLLRHGRNHRGEIPAVMKGMMPSAPERSFQVLDLGEQIDRDLAGRLLGADAGAASGPMDLRGTPVGDCDFSGVSMRVADPAGNGAGGCIGIARSEGYSQGVVVPVGALAQSLYILHSATGGAGRVGELVLHYADGESVTRRVTTGREVLNWWYPKAPFSRKRMPAVEIACEGANDTCARFGVTLWGLDNPRPDATIDRIEFRAGDEGACWYVLGVSLCDAPHFMTPPDVSFGPVKWCTGAVIYALLEGLAGVRDDGVAFDAATVAPRWTSAGVKSVAATIRYEASDGYVRYRYKQEPDAIDLELTGSGEKARLRVLLPKGKSASRVTIDGEEVPFEVETIEQSTYACMSTDSAKPHHIRIALKPGVA
jgi:hypothetical protein